MIIRKLYIFIIFFSFLAHIGCSSNANSDPRTWINYDRRTTGTIIDDQAICVKANMALMKEKDIWKNSHIGTLSYGHSLLIVGQTDSKESRKKIEHILIDIPEVKSIYNQLTIGKPISLAQRTKDSWITTQVKTKIMSNRKVGPNRVKVITEDNVVYLMGRLTKQEEKIVSDLASRVKGVEEVVKIFEVY